MPSDRVLARVDEVVPQGVTHVGFVLSDVDGAVSLHEPASPTHGVTVTLPRVKVGPGEPYSRAVNRCLKEVIGWEAESLFPIHQVWVTPNSATFFFAGWTTRRTPVGTLSLRWQTPDEAQALLAQAPYAPTRQRNLGALAAVRGMCLSPYRRVQEMVRELHRMGYERLRAPAYLYPLAWRCPVVPASWTLREHGGTYQEVSLEHALAAGAGHTTYTGAAGQESLFTHFPMGNVEFASPHELAEGFLRLRPAIALAGWGPDAEYVTWFQQALDVLRPHGLYYAFGEGQSPRDSLYTLFSTVGAVRLPPPGQSSRAEWGEFERRHAHE
jgi:hypothetical protein